MNSIVEKILSQKVLGYSQDFKQTYIQHQVMFRNGDVSIMFSTDETRDDGTINSGHLTEMRPYVAIPNKN